MNLETALAVLDAGGWVLAVIIAYLALRHLGHALIDYWMASWVRHQNDRDWKRRLHEKGQLGDD